MKTMELAEGKSLDAIAEKIGKLYESKSDEEIAEELKITTQQVTALRMLKGFYKKIWSSAFEKLKKVGKDEKGGYFIITLRMNSELQKKLGITFSSDYNYYARVSGKGNIEIEISQR